MTPKEKAKELIRKFYSIGAVECKQCALISVDEIMKAPHENEYIELIPSDAEDTDWFWYEYENYWEEVKNELEKL